MFAHLNAFDRHSYGSRCMRWMRCIAIAIHHWELPTSLTRIEEEAPEPMLNGGIHFRSGLQC